MSKKKGFRSYLITIGGAVVVFVLVAAFLGGLRSTTEVIAGVDSGASDGPRIQSDIIPSMFRDAGKYLIYLGIVVQSPSELPPGIISSCNNLAVGQLKDGEDVKVVMSGLARSPVGFVDTHYARFVNRMQRGQFILKLGLAWDVAQTEPLLFKPLVVEAREPGAGEIAQEFAGTFRGRSEAKRAQAT